MFLLRSTSTASSDHPPRSPSPPPIQGPTPAPAISYSVDAAANYTSQASKETTSQSKTVTLESLIADGNFAYAEEEHNGEGRNQNENENAASLGSRTYVKDHTPMPNRHTDVAEDEGWITIPQRELPGNWNETPGIQAFRSLDRSFVFPGEQVHIMACLFASERDTEIVTPFKLAAVMNRNCARSSEKKQNGHMAGETLSESSQQDAEGQEVPKDVSLSTNKNESQLDVSSGETIIRMENQRRQMQTLLHKMKESHFFVRISEPNELLWSKRSTMDTSDAFNSISEAGPIGNVKDVVDSINTMIDRGSFDARTSGGALRNPVQCCSLANGDIVILLQMNVGDELLKEPTLEILQFEKYKDENSRTSMGEDTTATSSHEDIDRRTTIEGGDPFGELLKWLHPLDNSHPPHSRPLSPTLNSTSLRSSLAPSSSSQIFSFGNFRSYSMSSLSVPQNSTPASASASSAPSMSSSKSSFGLEDWDRLASQKSAKGHQIGSEGLLSFRGVALEPERFSVRCGLEGIYVPGRRWRKQLEIIQPIDIHTFAANCNTDELLCVQIKNVSPAHIPDIIVYIDTMTIIFEEASKAGPPLSIPVTCIEAGTEYAFPNIALRRGEEHSFVLKPATSILKLSKMHADRASLHQSTKSNKPPIAVRLPLKTVEATKTLPISEEYSVLVSCHCNYTESRLFFKKHTKWKPRISRDLMISVASELSKQNIQSDSRVSLPVQVLTLQATNMTMEDLTLTILAPASMNSRLSVLSVTTKSTLTPKSPFLGLGSMPVLVEYQEPDDEDNDNDDEGSHEIESVPFDDQGVRVSDYIPTTALACNHLWLRSRVPLGCVPSQSTATVKVEWLPLTDGVITLDTLQISVKEKGSTYIPEETLKINATSSIANGII